MSIGFNEVPANLRVPFVYAEFDNQNAVQGPSLQPYKILMMGPMLGTGTKAALSLNLVTSFDQAKTYFGAGSLVSEMTRAFFDNNSSNELYVVPLEDAGGGVVAAGSMLLGGAASAAGTLKIYIAGKVVSVAVAAGDALADVISEAVDIITADDEYLVAAAINGGVPEQIDFTAKNKGTPGNKIDIRMNYFDGDETPGGLTTTITPMAAGATNPDLATVFATLDETQYILMVSAFVDAANLLVVETELADRFGPIRQNDGYCFYAEQDTLSNLVTLGDSRNSQFTVIHRASGPSHPASHASAKVGVVAANGQIDPARPFQTLEVAGILAESDSEKLTLTERNTLLFHGIATDRVSDGGKVLIEREITTYKKNNAGGDDVSYLDLNSLLTLSYLRYDFKNTILLKYPRHKLADDGTNFGAGQPVMTPKVMKGEAVNKFRQWELAGLVEGAEQFKNDLIVERNAIDSNRLDVLLPPDLMNQFRVAGVKIGFLL